MRYSELSFRRKLISCLMLHVLTIFGKSRTADLSVVDFPNDSISDKIKDILFNYVMDKCSWDELRPIVIINGDMIYPKNYKYDEDIPKGMAKCAQCGSTDRLGIHCIDGNVDNIEESNIIVLCWKCDQEVYASRQYMSKMRPKL